MPVDAPEIVETDNTRVACDGGGGDQLVKFLTEKKLI